MTFFYLLKERYQSFDYLDRDDKSSCKEAASDEDFIELKFLYHQHREAPKRLRHKKEYH